VAKTWQVDLDIYLKKLYNSGILKMFALPFSWQKRGKRVAKTWQVKLVLN